MHPIYGAAIFSPTTARFLFVWFFLIYLFFGFILIIHKEVL